MATIEKQVQTHINVQLTDRDRQSAFFRWVLIAPVFILLYSLTSMVHTGLFLSGFIFVPVVLTLLFRGVYPSYVLTFNHAILEFNSRLTAYALL